MSGSIRRFLGSLLTVLLASSSGYTQSKEIFDLFNFIPPSGYTRTEGAFYLDFIQYNSSKTAYTEFTLYKSREGTSEIRAEFLKEWNEIVKKEMKTEAPEPSVEKPDEDGWVTAYGSAPIQYSGGDYSQTLITVSGFGRVTSISIRVTKDGDTREVESFLSGIKMQPLIKPLPASAPVPSTAAGKYSGNSVVGVWRGIGSRPTISGVTNAAGTGYSSVTHGNEIAVKQIAFMEDGAFTFVLPSTGLLTVADDMVRNPNSWGTFQPLDKENGKVLYGSSQYPYQIKNGILAFDGTEFQKQIRTDHQKLSGTFTAEKNMDRWKGQTNLEPTVTFTSDGTFSDQGAFYYIRHVRGYTTDTQDNNYGSGRYDIINYTITFSYSDGRKIDMSFLDFGTNQISLSKSILDRK